MENKRTPIWIAKTRKTAVLSIAAILLAWNANAAEMAGVVFNEKYEDNGIKMTLQGLGQKNVLLFKAFVASFYRDDTVNEEELGKFPKRIEVEYFVNIPGIKLNNFTVDSIKDNINEDEFASLKNEIELMRNYFVDLKPGDRFSLTYLPGVGTQFAHNGRITGIIEGSEFARALFSVWIGDKPFDSALKKQILTKDKSKSNKQNDLAMLSKS